MKKLTKILCLIVAFAMLMALSAGADTTPSVSNDIEYLLYVADSNENQSPFYSWTIESFDGAYGLSENETSVLHNMKYYVISDEEIKTFSFDNELKTLFEDYGNETSGYRRPIPEISFENGMFTLKTSPIPEESSFENFSEILDNETKDVVNEEIFYEFLMRTYGVQRSEVISMYIHSYCVLVDHCDCGDESCDLRNVTDIPVAKYDFRAVLLDGSSIKLPINPRANEEQVETFYLTIGEKGDIVQNYLYPWNWGNS